MFAMDNVENTSVLGSKNSRKNGSKSTCLFCYTPILLENSNPQEQPEDFLKLNKVLKALCFHLQTGSGIGLPKKCSRKLFPFCDECEKLLEHFWEYQEIMEAAKRRISKLVTMIEQKVADGELIGRELKLQNIIKFRNTEENKFIKLREMILEGYRNKLLMKQRLRDNVVLGNRMPTLIEPNYSHMVVMKDNEFNAFRSRIPTTFTINEDTPESSSTASSSSSRSEENQVEDNSRMNQQTHENLETISTSSSLTALMIKQEIISSAQHEDSISETDDSSIDVVSDVGDDIMALEVRNRRLMYKGIEIFKCVGFHLNQEYLNCSICSYRVPYSKNWSRSDMGMTPLKRLKDHILNFHDDVLVAKTKPKPKLQAEVKLHPCLLCKETFTTRKELRDHKETHPFQQTRECDICGRIMKTKSQFHLILHKFSHKSDEERKAAIAAGESGTYTPLLCVKLRNHFMRKKKVEGDTDFRVGMKTKKVARRMAIIKPVNCPICDRVFSKKCYLSRHIKTHNSNYKKQMRKQVYSKKSTLSNLIGLLHKRKPVNKKYIPILSPQKSNNGLRAVRSYRRGNLKVVERNRIVQEETEFSDAPILQRMVDLD